jgi:hypothetical protein
MSRARFAMDLRLLRGGTTNKLHRHLGLVPVTIRFTHGLAGATALGRSGLVRVGSTVRVGMMLSALSMSHGLESGMIAFR